MLRIAVFIAVTLTGVQLSTSIAFSTSVHAQTIVRDIQVNGNRRVEPETVRSYLDFTIGDQYDPSRVNASLRSLFETGLF
ncbi:MAG: outer membrane protein insertion porin family, partial [Hyphomicrobiaceae bacterium]